MNKIRIKNELNEGGDLSISRGNDTDYLTIKTVTTGSEKQNVWAQRIKCGFISCLFCWMNDPMYAKCENRLMAAVNKVNDFDDARILIDNRDMTKKEVVRWMEGI